MDAFTIGLHPEGDTGPRVFRMTAPGLGQILRGEVKVQTISSEQHVSSEEQKAAAMEKVRLLVEMLLKASESP